MSSVFNNLKKRCKSPEKKVAFLTNIIAPYRIPCFNKIAEYKRFDFEVIFLAENEKNKKWKTYKEIIKFKYKILKGLHFTINSERTFHLNFGLIYHILKKDYDVVVIGGYDQIAMWEALIICKILGIKIIISGESTLRDKRKENRVYENMKRFFIKNSNGFITAGKAAAEYFKHLGASPERIFITPFSTNHYFLKKEFLRLKDYKKRLKAKKGYPEITILFSGRFVVCKGIPFLLDAYARLRENRNNIGLVLLGDGPEKEKYINYCEKNKVYGVFFEDFVQQEELPRFYASADIFVLPSISESWGIVINEAMAFGLPIVSTDAAGASYDLIKNGINGFVVRAGDTNELYIVLEKLYEDKRLRIRMGKESLKIIEDYTPEKWAQSFIYAINNILGF